jgi:large subunit ribosomal protein L21
MTALPEDRRAEGPRAGHGFPPKNSKEKPMYAVIRTGGKQYRVAQGDRVKIEKLAGDVGGKVNFEVLLVGGEGEAKVGKPTVSGAAVEGEIVGQGKHKKVINFRKKKEGWTKKRGHRQPFTEVLITTVRA